LCKLETKCLMIFHVFWNFLIQLFVTTLFISIIILQACVMLQSNNFCKKRVRGKRKFYASRVANPDKIRDKKITFWVITLIYTIARNTIKVCLNSKQCLTLGLVVTQVLLFHCVSLVMDKCINGTTKSKSHLLKKAVIWEVAILMNSDRNLKVDLEFV
jgi:hypothetical protein